MEIKYYNFRNLKYILNMNFYMKFVVNTFPFINYFF